jgi:hypothetical protein
MKKVSQSTSAREDAIERVLALTAATTSLNCVAHLSRHRGGIKCAMNYALDLTT